MPDRKAIVTDFIKRCALGDSVTAFDQYVSRDFVHHNPWFASDATTLAHAMRSAYEQFPQTTITVHRVLADGDLLMTHSEVRHAPDKPVFACSHIFRFEGDQIAELWDVAMESPAVVLNERGLF